MTVGEAERRRRTPKEMAVHAPTTSTGESNAAKRAGTKNDSQKPPKILFLNIISGAPRERKEKSMQFGMKIIDLVRETNEDSIENAPLIPVSCEQPVLWYELHDLSLGVTFGFVHEGSGFAWIAAIRALLREVRTEKSAPKRPKNSKHSLQGLGRNSAGGPRSALNTKEACAQVPRVVLVSQR